MAEKKIRVVRNGPYIVTGGIPLYKEMIKTPAYETYVWAGRTRYENLPETYSLCRCGKSKDSPFCDNTHQTITFNAEEKATFDSIKDRAMIYEGEEVHLLDDIDLCSWSRFCHTPRGKTWDLLEVAADKDIRDLMIKSAQDCPSGRLVPIDAKTGQDMEPDLPQELVISQDPERDCSGPIMVRGGIPVESATGRTYEVRNRQALCRCGSSHNPPFCDARHAVLKWDDGHLQEDADSLE